MVQSQLVAVVFGTQPIGLLPPRRHDKLECPMNEPVSDLVFKFPCRLTPRTPELQKLFDHIAAGEPERERERILPFDVIDLIRRSRLGALRIP
jgi:hypothetical protein